MPIQKNLLDFKTICTNESYKDILLRKIDFKEEIFKRCSQIEIPKTVFLSMIRETVIKMTKIIFYNKENMPENYFAEEDKITIDELIGYYLEACRIVFKKEKTTDNLSDEDDIRQDENALNNEGGLEDALQEFENSYNSESYKDNLKKSKYIYCLSADLVESLSDIFVFSLDLPMVNKPVDWRIDEKTKKLNWGAIL